MIHGFYRTVIKDIIVAFFFPGLIDVIDSEQFWLTLVRRISSSTNLILARFFCSDAYSSTIEANHYPLSGQRDRSSSPGLVTIGHSCTTLAKRYAGKVSDVAPQPGIRTDDFAACQPVPSFLTRGSISHLPVYFG